LPVRLYDAHHHRSVIPETLAKIMSGVLLPFPLLAVAASPTGEAAGAASDAGGVMLLIVAGAVSIAVSFLCSVAEAVLLCVTPSYIATRKDEGSAAAATLERMKQNIDRPLSAILSLNTIAHTVGAAGVGAQAAVLWGSQAVGWASAVMTLLILVLSEIIPKTLGAVYWRELAPWIARTITVMIWVLFPLVWLSELVTRMISGGRQDVVTRDEVAAMAVLSRMHGELEHGESTILANLFLLPTLKVQDIMTPRTVMISLPEELTVGEMHEQRPDLPVSRIPVYSGSIDNVTGFVLRTDVLLAHARGEQQRKLADLRREIKGVPATASLTDAFSLLLNQREHIALVVDEYGGTDGLVTMEDLIETLLGLEIIDEADAVPDLQRMARRKWEKRARSLGLAVAPSSTPPPKPQSEAAPPEARPPESTS
jgi:CBS domain containing-hemolysin-like protein